MNLTLAPSNVPTISPAVCTGAAIAGGASAGALIGEGVGGFVGGLLGGGGGTLVAPGVGTVGGGIAGASAGAGIGAGVGGFIGGLVGGAASNILCSKGGGSSFGGNQRENKQANDAKNEAERISGKKFTRAQERISMMRSQAKVMAITNSFRLQSRFSRGSYESREPIYKQHFSCSTR